MKKLLTLGLILTFSFSGFTQQVYYNVSAGTGNGLRFWNDDSFKIHMGNTSEYHFGPVYDYSIKTNMSNDSGRGWTWGVHGATPVAGLSNTGHFQIAGSLSFNNLNDGSNEADGITWYTSDPLSYGIFRTPGAWSAPSYQQLKLNFATGIILDPGSLYEKSYVDVLGGGLRVSSGIVGIGTTTPYNNSRLHVKSNYPNPWGVLAEASSNDRIIGINHDGTSGVISVSYLVNGGWSPLQLITKNIPRLTIESEGNVGIGTTTPDSKLTVKGIIHTQEVKVDLNGSVAPDYVFEQDYPLPSLEGLKAYIDQNKHLPEVPSAKEMEVDGINLKEMNLLLLKKVEELTLYLIELKKENNSSLESLQSQIDQLKRK